MVQELTSTTVDNENGANVALVVGSYMENISAHGIPNIKRAQSKIRRLLWVCAFLASFSMCIWQVKLLISAYLGRQVTTNMDIKSVTSLGFPAVTICNLNNMRLSYLENHEQLKSELEYGASTQSNPFQQWDYADLDTREDYFDLIDKVTEFVAVLPYNDRAYTGHNVSNALLTCTFNGYPCLPRNFTYTYNYLYGNCYTFNDGTYRPIKYTTNAGPLYGLTLEINIQQDEYISQIQPAAGLRIIVHDWSEMPFPEDQGITVPPGAETNIGIHRVEYRRLPAPFPSECLEGDVSTIFSKTFAGITYSKRACMKNCIFMETFNYCGCYNPRYVFDPETTPICTGDDAWHVNCTTNVEYRIAIGNITCNCGPACTEILYKTSISSSMWPGNMYMDSVVKQFEETPYLYTETDTIDYIETNFAKVNIYYENLQYDYIEQVATYTLLSLISNVGGNLGLWIGMSALTLLEFLECFYDTVKHICAAVIRRRKAKQWNKKNTSVDVQPSRIAFQNDAFSQK